ncbi:MAG: hypothetical protein ACRD07_12485 [Acidimicrobiales bacterium]
MVGRGRRRGLWAAAGIAAVALTASTGCAWGGQDDEPEDGLAPDTARFTYGDRQVEVPLTSCGRDEEEDVVLLAGRRGAVVVQAAADLGDEGFDRTGVTADLGDAGIVGAFGAELDQGPAGEISDVRIDGDRLIVEGTWVPLDAELEPTAAPSAGGVEGELRARCPADNDGGGDTAARRFVATPWQ